jgi:hypothetical protein
VKKAEALFIELLSDMDDSTIFGEVRARINEWLLKYGTEENNGTIHRRGPSTESPTAV